MILISHRGNIDGKNPQSENTEGYVLTALNRGYEVEIDVWYKHDHFYLGHDEPTTLIYPPFVMTQGLWCHAKNAEALYQLVRRGIHCFYIEEDQRYTLTSRKYIWTSPGEVIVPGAIAVRPESCDGWLDNNSHAGICSDYISRWRNNT